MSSDLRPLGSWYAVPLSTEVIFLAGTARQAGGWLRSPAGITRARTGVQ